MTTCEDMTFERLLAHVTHSAHGTRLTDGGHLANGGHLDEPVSDLALVHHVAFCDRCSARVLALRVQSLALAALGRGLWGPGAGLASQSNDLDSSAEVDHADLWQDLYETTGSPSDSALLESDHDTDFEFDIAFDGESDGVFDVDVRADADIGAASGHTTNAGPSACLGAVRDAGLASYHRVLRELFVACLWGDPQRAMQHDDPAPLRTCSPRPVREIALDLTSLAKRLNGLGLAITADDLPNAMPSPQQVAETAGPILDRITALEGPSTWVAQARIALRDA